MEYIEGIVALHCNLNPGRYESVSDQLQVHLPPPQPMSLLPSSCGEGKWDLVFHHLQNGVRKFNGKCFWTRLQPQVVI